MQFIYEKDLKAKFWDFYKNRKSIKKYQFECTARDGGVDLLTVEEYQEEYQICAFEFKLTDIKKAFAQAEYNLAFSHKSFVVVPAEKEDLIKNKYLGYLKEKRNIGVIGVQESGRWNIIHQPYSQKTVELNQTVLKLIMKGF